MIWNNEELCRQYIQSCNIQGLFSTPVLGEICLHRFARGENIYREGEPLRELYFLVKGQVKVFRTHHNGKVSVVEFASAFDILGELELVNARDTTISVQALRECHCLGLSMARCREQLLRATYTTPAAAICSRSGSQRPRNTSASVTVTSSESLPNSAPTACSNVSGAVTASASPSALKTSTKERYDIFHR